MNFSLHKDIDLIDFKNKEILQMIKVERIEFMGEFLKELYSVLLDVIINVPSSGASRRELAQNSKQNVSEKRIKAVPVIHFQDQNFWGDVNPENRKLS